MNSFPYINRTVRRETACKYVNATFSLDYKLISFIQIVCAMINTGSLPNLRSVDGKFIFLISKLLSTPSEGTLFIHA